MRSDGGIGMKRRSMDVEAVLHWAYRDELPKSSELGGSAGGAISPMFRMASLGGPVDNWSRDPGFPMIMGDPHPDALVVARAVTALRSVELAWPASRELLAPEFGALLADHDVTITSLLIDVPAYVTMHARMGTRPDWFAGEWRCRRQVGRNGKVRVEGLGEDGGAKAGAYCPLTIEPEPREVVADRAIYVAWHAGLEALAGVLGESLEYAEVTGPVASPAPWAVPDAQPVILPDLSAPATLRRVSRRRPRRAA